MNSTISQTAVFGEVFQTQENIIHFQPRTDKDVRESYNAKVSEAYQEFVKTAVEFHDNEQCFGDHVAREAFDTRNKIKEEHQAQTSLIGRVGIYIRNLVTYGAGNATYEGLSRKKNPEEIAYAAFKTDGADLGLSGNGFGDRLKTWDAIKSVSTIYPEDITPAMIAAFKAQPAGKIDPALILAARDIEEVTVQQVVEKTSTTKVPSLATALLLSKDEVMAPLTHSPRRNYAFM